MVRRTGLKRFGDFLEELRQRHLAERIDRSNEYHCDQRGDDAHSMADAAQHSRGKLLTADHAAWE